MGIEHEDTFLFEASGYSMVPFVWPGTRLVVKKVDASLIRTGDLVVYMKDKILVCHRCVGTRKCGKGFVLLIRGDASRGAAESIAPVDLVGKVIVASGCRQNPWLNLAIVCIAPFVARLRALFKPAYRPLKNILRRKGMRC